MVQYADITEWANKGTTKYARCVKNGEIFRFGRRADGDFDLQSQQGTEWDGTRYVDVFKTETCGSLLWCWREMCRLA